MALRTGLLPARRNREFGVKELHDLQIDRTSCSDFWANQFRVLLTAAAYLLMQELRLQAAHTSCARAQVGRIRERLLKLGARVIGFGSPRGRASARVVPVSIHFPASGTGTRSLDGMHPPAPPRPKHNLRKLRRRRFGEALCQNISTLASSDKPVILTTHRTGRCTLPSTPSPQCRPQKSTSGSVNS